MEIETRPTTIRLNNNTEALINFLKSMNKTKFGSPSTLQIIAYAIQLAAYEQAMNYNNIKLLTDLGGFIDNVELRAKLKDRIKEVSLLLKNMNVFDEEDPLQKLESDESFETEFDEYALENFEEKESKKLKQLRQTKI